MHPFLRLFAVSILLIGFVLSAALIFILDRGFDLGDESSNLLLAIFPESLTASPVFAGDITHWVWRASGEDIASFRRLGAALLIGQSTLTAWLFSRLVREEYFQKNNINKLSPLIFIAIGILGAVLYYRYYYVPSPGYNWLALFGILHLQSGFLLFALNKRILTAGSTLSIGLFLTYMGKPTSGFAILLCLIAALVVYGQSTRSILTIAWALLGAVALALAHMLLMRGGIETALSILADGFTAMSLLGSNHGNPGALVIGLIGALTVGPVLALITTQWVTLTLMAIYAGLIRVKKLPINAFAVSTLLIVSMLESLIHDPALRNIYAFTSLLAVAALGAFGLSAGHLDSSRPLRNESWHLPSRGLVAALLLSAMSVPAFVVGSDGEVANKMVYAIACVLPASLIVVQLIQIRSGQRFLIPVFVSCIVVYSIGTAYRTYADPFGVLSNLHIQRVSTAFTGSSRPLNLDSKTSNFVVTLADAASTAGFAPGTPLVNLTGGVPGVNVILKAPFITTHTLYTGRGAQPYSGAEAFAAFAFERSAHDVTEAWILTSNSPSAHSTDLLMQYGSTFPCGYEMVEQVSDIVREYIVYTLWKPTGASENCR